MRLDGARIVYDGTLIDVTIEQWGEHEREIVLHPGAAAIVAVDEQDRVVLVRQLREPARKVLLELPAGGLAEGERPIESAQRELAEETGLRGGTWRHVVSFWTTPGFCNELMHLFFAEGVEEGDQRQEEDESIELVRVAVPELPSRLAEIEDGKSLVGLLLYLREQGL